MINNRRLSKYPRNHQLWFDGFFDEPLFVALDRKANRLAHQKVFTPTTDVRETEKELKIVCNLPGTTK